MRQGWLQTLVASQADGPAVTTNAADTSMLPTPAIFLLPANFIESIGTIFTLRARGRMTTTAAGTLTFTVYFGAVKVFTGTADTVVTTLTNLTFDLEIGLTSRTIGSGTAATLMGSGEISSGIYGAAGAVTTKMLPISAPVVGTGFDSTISQAIDLRANWSLTGQSLTCHQYKLLSEN
jgi:hypothetical protein